MEIVMRNSRMARSKMVWMACVGTAMCSAAALSVAGDKEKMTDAKNITSQTFVKKAGMANMAEVETSKLAMTKAQSPEVRKFADQMVKDHTKASSELMTLAKNKNLDVPKEVDAEHKAAMDALKAKSGADFDQAFMAQMKKDHDKAVSLFQSASSASGVDKDLQAFAQKTLPTLEHHQHMATTLNTKQASVSTGSTNQ
jgi:putative membrane protein